MVIHRYFIEDGNLLETSEYQPNNGIEIYEVIRVIRGVPLFTEDHLKRFFHSAWLCHLEIPLNGEMLSSMLEKLINVNQVKEGNIRFSYCFRPTGTFQAYFIPHFYPDEHMVKNGVVCRILHEERTDPNVKIIQSGIRDQANLMMAKSGRYEVLLVNQRGEFTEGSRSNLFFLKDGVFITAASEDILPGITRQKIMELIVARGKKVVERNVREIELPFAEGAFLTGTSPKVLPIRNIENQTFKTDHTEIRELMADYDLLIEQYIRNRLQD
jgi:branched-chain amino acid aminotransferase